MITKNFLKAMMIYMNSTDIDRFQVKRFLMWKKLCHFLACKFSAVAHTNSLEQIYDGWEQNVGQTCISYFKLVDI